MSVTTDKNGRLCNQIIRNLSLSLLAKKYDLYASYSEFNNINDALGIELFVGKNTYSETKTINNSNYMSYLLDDIKVTYNLDLMDDYFQSEEITNVLHKHLRSNASHIMDKNPYRNRYQNNNDLFVHIRLGDSRKHNVGIDYYINCINSINFDNIYIASDNFGDSVIQKLKNLYPKAIFFTENPVSTIQFGSTCKNIILSHGSFSAVIGYLAFFSNVYFPNSTPGWCPLGMFLNKGWFPVNLKIST